MIVQALLVLNLGICLHWFYGWYTGQQRGTVYLNGVAVLVLWIGSMLR